MGKILVLLLVAAAHGNKSGWYEDPSEPGCWRLAGSSETWGCNKDGTEDEDDKKPPPPPLSGSPLPPASSPSPARPKILCLHGGGGSAASFQPAVAHLMQSASNFEFIFVDAPSNGLWMGDPPGGKGQPTTDPNWDLQSVQLLDGIVQSQGPFYGLLGYSQVVQGRR